MKTKLLVSYILLGTVAFSEIANADCTGLNVLTGKDCGYRERVANWSTDPVGKTVNEIEKGAVQLREQTENVWKRLGKGWEYHVEICNKVGWEICSTGQITALFMALQEGKLRGLYNNTGGCVAVGLSLNQGGHKAAQLVAAYEGIPIPEELMQISKQATQSHIVAICEALFHETFIPNDIVGVGNGVFVEKNDAKNYMDKVTDNINAIQSMAQSSQKNTNIGSVENRDGNKVLIDKIDAMEKALQQKNFASERNSLSSVIIQESLKNNQHNVYDQNATYTNQRNNDNNMEEKGFYLKKEEDAKKKIESQRLF